MADTDYLATSADYKAMLGYWTKVAAIRGGVDAMRKAGKSYLPQFPNESDPNYDYRLANSKFTDIYSDIVENLASKPFSKEVTLANDTVPEAIKVVTEDVDGGGNHLHVFADTVFFNGIHNAIDWILVDYPTVPQGATLADEKRMGARPYWVNIPATDMLWVESKVINGKEQFTYAKIYEPVTQRDSAGTEQRIDRVRILLRDELEGGQYGPARYEIWEKATTNNAGWSLIAEGPISIGVIALVPFFTGRRDGSTWRIRPPMRNVAELQVEHYQQETNLKSAKELTAFPMLAGNGVTPPVDENGKPIMAPIGPSVVLYAPPTPDGTKSGQWQFIEPSASSLKFLSEEVDKTETQMRELGRQPLTAGTSGITQVAAAFASQKSASAVQAWAFMLKDCLERAYVFTSMWLNVKLEPTVYVNTDFAIELGEDKAPDTLLTMNERGKLSTQTLWQEMKRRSILSPEFDADEEEKRIMDELPGDDTEDDLTAAVTPPVKEPAE
ncbi:DUF4055 domain-containing protein [Brucella anthropi]|uniref:DUF4055 domain-containing protein n=1 Tax=Brucella anthropi TaxID=529 RepID=UPI00241C7A36|nr:DUF4055 domain-containing protein [Brucella anthropi]MDG9793058.1 DUF4055 domain-containing protein [Brucella anthropi]MDH0580216.1 DUF4055 domain-containing protein [Brucella anthropi]MDH0816840.1 DUF4055 domain-containing protein [Brucella anthropi]MDH2083372.1 DUF4055 domain-containing protein [Brucella anthropi]